MLLIFLITKLAKAGGYGALARPKNDFRQKIEWNHSMSSNHLLPTLPVSQSADDLTQSQLEEAYSSEDDIEEKIPSVKEELERIAVAIETACNQQQKLGETMVHEVRSITEHVKNAVIIEMKDGKQIFKATVKP